jgi:CheY-like chemotaxis protein
MKTKKSLLVVDDTCAFRKLIKLLLSDTEFDVLEAENGSDALDVILNSEVDIVICDMFMSVMDGYGFLKALKQDKEFFQFSEIPVVLVSGDMSGENIAKCKELGVDSWLPKPFNPLELINIIGDLTTENKMSNINGQLIKSEKYQKGSSL